ncbi:E3 ubiquitin-protein ligase RNF135 [Hemicordylus capensis]|uniref:E3 ubiquitin-protein ligase RNF135 n=1 Tax=Hemicordylus capensis TaxID=884348 RepID=UPI002303166F|nr:E3 ubiquitin-protein ligase RNF135 [Hemicordylus capensis]
MSRASQVPTLVLVLRLAKHFYSTHAHERNTNLLLPLFFQDQQANSPQGCDFQHTLGILDVILFCKHWKRANLFSSQEDELTCCLCLDYFKQPVLVTKCSHNFCKECISQHCKETGAKASCPKCRGELHPQNLVDNRQLANIVETFQHIKETPRTWGRDQEKCQEILKLFLEEKKEASGCQTLKLSAGLLDQHKDMVKISDISKQTEGALEAIINWTKEKTEIKDHVSHIKSSVVEDFSFIKKYIDDQEEMMLEAVDLEYTAVQQKISIVNEQLTARVEKLLELQNNLEELQKNVSSEQEVYVGSPVAMNEVALDIQKINSIAFAVQEFKKMLEKSGYPVQLLQEPPPGIIKRNEIQMDLAQGEIASSSNSCGSLSAVEPSPGTSKINEYRRDMAQHVIASSSNSSQSQDSLQETGHCSSSLASNSNSPMSVISSRFSQWASDVTFDLKRINCKLEITEDKRRVSVSLSSFDYEPSLKRFRNSQVLGTPGFSEGCHYWEVSTKDSNGWAIGIADENIGRFEQLGRTERSWCIEWSKYRLSAWHSNKETLISAEKPRQVGVFLEIPKNCLSFYSLTDEESCLHKFDINVVNPVYPAFWIYHGSVPGECLTINNIKRYCSISTL